MPGVTVSVLESREFVVTDIQTLECFATSNALSVVDITIFDGKARNLDNQMSMLIHN